MTELINYNDPFKALSKLIDATMFPAQTFPKVDVYLDEDENLNYKFALAGFDKADIAIELDGNKLRVKGHKEDKEEKNQKYLVRTIAQRDFHVSYLVPQEYNLNTAYAVFDNGILNIMLKKKEQADVRRIEIKDSRRLLD